jgi:outer membrane receptor protein involved in Fe transport
VNFPEAEIEGVEGEFQWLITDDLEFTSSFAKINSEISKTSTLFPRSNYPFTVVKGTKLPLSPDFKASAGLQYTLPCELFGSRPYLKLDYSYTGESYNSVGSEAIIVGSPPQRQDDYSLVDFSAGLDTGSWSAQLWINNLTDERAQEFFNNRWGKSRLSINDPRAIGVTMRKNF